MFNVYFSRMKEVLPEKLVRAASVLFIVSSCAVGSFVNINRSRENPSQVTGNNKLDILIFVSNHDEKISFDRLKKLKTILPLGPAPYIPRVIDVDPQTVKILESYGINNPNSEMGCIAEKDTILDTGKPHLVYSVLLVLFSKDFGPEIGRINEAVDIDFGNSSEKMMWYNDAVPISNKDQETFLNLIKRCS